MHTQMERQLTACSDALAHTLKQKDVAKEMLRLESERTSKLSGQVQQLQALTKYVGWSLQAVISDTKKVWHTNVHCILFAKVAAFTCTENMDRHTSVLTQTQKTTMCTSRHLTEKTHGHAQILTQNLNDRKDTWARTNTHTKPNTRRPTARRSYTQSRHKHIQAHTKWLINTHTHTHTQANDQAQLVTEEEARRALEVARERVIADREQRIVGDVEKKKRVSRALIMADSDMQEQIIYPRYKACMPEDRHTHTHNSGNNNEHDRNHRNFIAHAHAHGEAHMQTHTHLDASNNHENDDSFDQITGQYGRSTLFTAEDWLFVNGGGPEASSQYHILSACPSSESAKLRETSGSTQSMSSSSHSQASTPLLTSVNRTWETAQCWCTGLGCGITWTPVNRKWKHHDVDICIYTSKCVYIRICMLRGYVCMCKVKMWST